MDLRPDGMRCVVRIVCGVLMTACAIPNIQAAEWNIESELGQWFGYDENIGLQDSGQEKVSGLQSTSSIDLTTAAHTPTTDLSLQSLFNFTQYPDNSDLNSNDQYFTLLGARRGERWDALLAGQYIHDTTRTTDAEDTGDFILQNKRRQFFSAAPEFNYRLTQTDTVNLSSAYAYNHYDTKTLPDSSTLTFGLGWAHDLSNRTAMTVNASGSRLNSNDSEEGNDNSHYYAMLFGVRHKFSENLQGNFSAGPTVAQTDRVETGNGTRRHVKEVTPGYGVSAGLQYAIEERLNFQGDFSRALTPSTTSGTLTEATSVRIAADYQVFQNLFVELPLVYIHRDDVGNSSNQSEGNLSRDYASVEPALRWRVSRDCDLRFGYGLQWQRNDSGDAFGNSVFTFLTYRLPALSMSR
jgi:hypothetical protein